MTTSASRITGESTFTDEGTDEYSLVESGDQGEVTYTQTLTGTDTYTLSESGNDQAGGLDRTMDGNGSYTLVSVEKDDDDPTTTTTVTATNTFGLTESGNYVDANLSISETGSDRYDLVRQFNNPSSATNNSPGTTDFSQVGAAVFVGMGVAPPTGGSSFPSGRSVVDQAFAQMAQSTGSLADQYVRTLEAHGLLEPSTGNDQSGAATNAKHDHGGHVANDEARAAAFGELGSQSEENIRGMEATGVIEPTTGNKQTGAGTQIAYDHGANTAVDEVVASALGEVGSLEELNVRGMEAHGAMKTQQGNTLSGASTQAKYDGLGQAHQYEYCFRKGTLVEMSDGRFVPIERLVVREIAEAAPDDDPTARPGPKAILAV